MFSALCLKDIAVVIDDSGSITEAGSGNWPLVLNFVKDTIYGLEIGPDKTQLAAVTFHNTGELQWDLDDYMNKNDLLDAVDKIKYWGGGTNTTGKMLSPSFSCVHLHPDKFAFESQVNSFNKHV